MNREQDRHRSLLRTSVLRAGALLGLACGLLAGPAWAQHFEPMDFYHYDALGSVRLVVSYPHDSGTYTISRHDYLPFGEEIQPGTFGRERDVELRRLGDRAQTGGHRALERLGRRFLGSGTEFGVGCAHSAFVNQCRVTPPG